MEYTEKILTALALPPGGPLLLGLLGLLLAWRQWRSGLALILLALASLWLLATPAVSDLLRASLEDRFPPLALDEVSRADAIVVLGGGIRPPHRDDPLPNLGRAADRYWHAARLWRAGKAPEILISGGALPWRNSAGSEAESAVRLLVELGVPAPRIVLEPSSLNTRQNARLSADLLRARDARRILLVTSALHMRRALARFRSTGLEVIPVAADHEAGQPPTGVLAWLPDSDALDGSRRALKEYLGASLGK